MALFGKKDYGYGVSTGPIPNAPAYGDDLGVFVNGVLVRKFNSFSNGMALSEAAKVALIYANKARKKFENEIDS